MNLLRFLGLSRGEKDEDEQKRHEEMQERAKQLV